MLKGSGGGYLRINGLNSLLISEWRRQGNAGVLAGKQPGKRIGRLRWANSILMSASTTFAAPLDRSRRGKAELISDQGSDSPQ